MMPAYLVMQIAIVDDERWRAYREAVMPLIERFGGKHVTRTGDLLLEGDEDGSRIVMFEFADVEAITSFWTSSDYAAVKPLRQGAARLRAWAVPIER